MGFDQYHEPPEELPARTRTFARLCASLTEEAEAIGWYEQRIALEQDPEALAVMRNAQTEEFKHFAMDLEFLLRRTPVWREIAQGILFTTSDIVEAGEEAEEDAGAGRLGRRRPARLAGDREPEGSGAVNHLLRELAPITEAGWPELDRRRANGSSPGSRRASSSTSPARSAGTTAPPTSAGSRRSRPSRASAPRSAGSSPLVELRADFSSRAPSCATSSAAPTTSTSTRSTMPRGGSRGPRTCAVFHGWAEAGFRGIAEACTHPRSPSEDFNAYARHIAEAVETLLRAGVYGPYGLALGAGRVHARDRDHRARRLPALRPPAKILVGGPIVWAPGVESAVVVSLRGGDFLFESGQDLSIGYNHHDAETVHLYLEESFSFRVATPEAACFISP